MNLAQNLSLVILYYLLLKVDSKCPKSFECGHLGSLEFPFSMDGKCGLFPVKNCGSESPLILVNNWRVMSVLEKISSNKFLLYDDSLHRSLSERSCFTPRNLSLPQSPFISFSLSNNLTLFSCHNQTYNEDIQSYFHDYERVQCHIHPPSVYYREAHVPVSDQTSIPSECSVVYLPKNPDNQKGDLFDLLTPEFTLEWNVSEACSECYHGGGHCLSDKLNKFHCRKADSKCQQSFQCGKFSFEFPFSDNENPECGLFMVDGCESDYPRIHRRGEDLGYSVVNQTSSNKLFIRDPMLEALVSNHSCLSFTNMFLLKSASVSFTFSPNLTLFSCINHSYSEPIDKYFHGYDHIDCRNPSVYYNTPVNDVPVVRLSDIPPECSEIQLPRYPDRNSRELFNTLSAEFFLEWNVSEPCLKCYSGGGQCLTDNEGDFYCKKDKSRLVLILAISLPGAGVLLLLLVVFMIWQRKKKSSRNYLLRNISSSPSSKSDIEGGGIIAALISSFIIVIHFIRRNYSLHRLFGCREAKLENERNIELFLKNNGNLVPLRYRYVDIKKMTKSFSENLGKGGYGSVYKGKLVDGRLVAVKILNESKENGEEFMNEVASISRTSHINIVTLLGFCFEGCKRALIYEFMPNGSLEKFIQNTAGDGLGWEKLFEISLGIARGLEYLHQGCKTRILHFDIKPQNILLDKDFNPRISDFGLAKMCPNRSSIVSMMVARGTIGYIAPEVFCRNFGEVSHKSDVYSYGMMVLEIAGGKKNIDRAEVDHTSEVYFPHYIYKQLEMDDAVSDGEIKNGDERQLAKRKLIIVGLWCIQTDPKERPSMTKVVEMLEGNLESLQLPPKPYISSPQDQHLIMFSTSETRNNVGLVC